MSVQVTIRLRNSSDAAQHAWLTLRISRREDQHLHFNAEIVEAVAKDPVSFMHPPSENEAKVVKAEIVGGILMARKQVGRVGFTAELVSLGGSVGEQRTLAAIPSVAFAVAAQLAVVQGLGVEDLRAKPHGGFGWKLDAVEVADAS